MRIACRQEFELNLTRDFQLSFEPLLFDHLLVQHHFLDDDCDLRSEQQEHFQIVVRIRVEFIAFEIEHADDFVVRNDWGHHLRMSAGPRVDVSPIAANVVGNVRLAGNGHVTDQAFAHLQVQFLQIVDVIAAHRLRMKNAGLIELAFPFGQRRGTLHQVDSRGVIGNQRVERVHHEVQHFVQVEGTTDRLRDVEQHAQLVDGR